MRSVLILRGGEAGEASAARFSALPWTQGLRPVLCPMLTFRDTPFDPPETDALVFTSTRGVAAWTRATPDRAPRVYAVGGATAKAARTAGFYSVVDAQGDAAALTARILADPWTKGRRLLHLRGRDAASDVAAALREHGLNADRLIAYKADLAANFPLEAEEALNTAAAALVYSARGGARFCALLANRSPPPIAALSPAALPPCALASATAEAPNESALFKAARELLQIPLT